MSEPAPEYGIVANVVRDPNLRRGAKVWLADGWSGGGWERVFVRGLSIAGDTVRKWMPSADLRDVRVVWAPENLRDRVWISDRASAEKVSASIAKWTTEEKTVDD